MSAIKVTITDLPTEILIRIGVFLPYRLGFPTNALNRALLGIFSQPHTIGIRAIAHYTSGAAALVHECRRLGPSQHVVVEAICTRLSRIDQGYDLNKYRARERSWHAEAITPLNAAASVGNAETVRVLLALGAECDEGGNSRRPLIRACEKGHLDVVKLIVEKDPGIQINIGMALYVTSSGGYVDVVRYLLNVATATCIEPITVQSCIRTAARNGHMDVVHVLLVDREGIDIHAHGQEVLWYAVMYGSAEMVQFLLDRGADPGVQSELRREAIESARNEEWTDILDIIGESYYSDDESSESNGESNDSD
ncbi:hypothetical protein HDU93_001704 [Gonapodya sp. JEL0774]|nr:hypothetical protein HDU93_001704 [Gonapodya sp. JEL0774]